MFDSVTQITAFIVHGICTRHPINSPSTRVC